MTIQEQSDRRRLKALLDKEIRSCRRCDGMNEVGVTQSAPGWGNLDSAVAIVGQSLCEKCMKPQEPFYKGSGTLLNACFDLARCDKADIFITNAVHCHPRGDRASKPEEIANCSSYLFRELEIVCPQLVIGLGEDAERVLSFLYPTARKLPWPFSAPINVRSKRIPCLLSAPHPSWVKRKHDSELEKAYVGSMAAALKWANAKGPLPSQRLPVIPTCAGMAGVPDE